ncbi:SRPBCC family protein [Streptomyces sp. NBC_01754]|uniref:SRPBCC family protein n=1 Tax=Streptomyces sp. NBC_01754 TaxID=2975930 RepID=UPI002DDBCFCD|nr:SRPBCC family protein [Streptomyces sp. NBC_01754]WSC91174.1 SRPBCC family protein [Streptomyces sp. NBC_01754]
MAVFRIERFTHLPAAEAWRRVTDWGRHGDTVPFTSVSVRSAPPTRCGTVFVARTGMGPLGVDDPMEVVRWVPPAAGRAGLCELEKLGSLVRGRASIDVRPTGAGSHVIWVEELRVRLLPRAADPLLASAGRRVFGRVLTTLLDD